MVGFCDEQNLPVLPFLIYWLEQEAPCLTVGRNFGELVCMANDKPAISTASGEKHDPGFAKISRELLPRLRDMSSNATKLYLWLRLKAFWKGPKRGCVETAFEDIASALGW